MTVIFRYDGRKYRGPSASAILVSLMNESHDRTTSPRQYRKAVACRVHQAYERKIRTDTPYNFLVDLVEVGAAHSITKLIGGDK